MAVSFDALRGANGKPGAVLSGSTMVQVVLGEVWKDSDIDVFCTAAAAPAVRTQLVQNQNFNGSECDPSYFWKRY